MAISNWHLQRYYNELNRDYFKGRLPKIPVRFGYTRQYPSRGYMAICLGNRILLKPFLKKSGKLCVWVLLHEMGHLSVPGSGAHGPRFMKEMRRLHREGAFDSVLYSA